MLLQVNLSLLLLSSFKASELLKLISRSPWSSSGSPPGGTCQEHLPREASHKHPIQMPEPPQLALLNVEEQRLYSELLLGDRAPHPISKEAPRHPAAETHFSRLYPGSYSLGHDPKFMTVGEGRRLTGKSRTSPFDSALSSPRRTNTMTALLRPLH